MIHALCCSPAFLYMTSNHVKFSERLSVAFTLKFIKHSTLEYYHDLFRAECLQPLNLCGKTPVAQKRCPLSPPLSYYLHAQPFAMPFPNNLSINLLESKVNSIPLYFHLTNHQEAIYIRKVGFNFAAVFGFVLHC